MITGACLCGALRYEVDGRLPPPVHCHCSRCRKHHGAPFATLAAVAANDFRWRSGEGSLIEHRSSPHYVRRSCATCGSVAPASCGDRVLVPAGNLLGELPAGGAHAFVASQAPWHVIADGLPRHDGAPPGWPLTGVVPAELPGEGAALDASPGDGATQGSCPCGAVAFTLSGAPLRWMQCHCSRCRRGRSAAHGSNAFYPAAQFAWARGQELARMYGPPEAERFRVAFCVRCGGSTPVERQGVPFVLVPMSLTDGDPGTRPQAHIFVGSKAAWYAPADGLPQFAELPPL
jgi:hypothetical protein